MGNFEVLGEPLTCVDLSDYATYIVVDPEDEFFPSEREKLYLDVVDAGLNLVVFADWFNATVIDKIRFLDENTKFGNLAYCCLNLYSILNV